MSVLDLPVQNRFLDQIEKEDAYKKHLKAVANAKHRIDTTRPDYPGRIRQAEKMNNRHRQQKIKYFKMHDEMIRTKAPGTARSQKRINWENLGADSQKQNFDLNIFQYDYERVVGAPPKTSRSRTARNYDIEESLPDPLSTSSFGDDSSFIDNLPDPSTSSQISRSSSKNQFNMNSSASVSSSKRIKPYSPSKEKDIFNTETKPENILIGYDLSRPVSSRSKNSRQNSRLRDSNEGEEQPKSSRKDNIVDNLNLSAALSDHKSGRVPSSRSIQSQTSARSQKSQTSARSQKSQTSARSQKSQTLEKSTKQPLSSRNERNESNNKQSENTSKQPLSSRNESENNKNDLIEKSTKQPLSSRNEDKKEEQLNQSINSDDDFDNSFLNSSKSDQTHQGQTKRTDPCSIQDSVLQSCLIAMPNHA